MPLYGHHGPTAAWLHHYGFEILSSSPQLLSAIADGAIIQPAHPTDNSPDRHTFLTTAEKLDVPHYVLKKLANHVSASDVTGGYIVVDVERLRRYMSLISEHFLKLLDARISDLGEPSEHQLPSENDVAQSYLFDTLAIQR